MDASTKNKKKKKNKWVACTEVCWQNQKFPWTLCSPLLSIWEVATHWFTACYCAGCWECRRWTEHALKEFAGPGWGGRQGEGRCVNVTLTQWNRCLNPVVPQCHGSSNQGRRARRQRVQVFDRRGRRASKAWGTAYAKIWSQEESFARSTSLRFSARGGKESVAST